LRGCAAGGGGANPGGYAVLPQSGPRSAAERNERRFYTVIDLGTIGGTISNAVSINEVGWIAGTANEAGDKYSQATLWRDDEKKALGTLGGPNSGVDWPNHNNFGLIAGISETAEVDHLGEDWSCQAFFPTIPDTKHVCLGFVWYRGTMRPLPTLGGINGYAAGTNDWGQIVGWAETAYHDPTCTAVTKTPNSFYQVLQFEPVVWDRDREIRRLRTLPGDPDGAATAINDRGQAVGISGTCDQAVGRFTAKHAVIWQAEGRVSRLPDFGGISWSTPQSINNRGQVVGFENLPGDTSGQFQPIGFFWSEKTGLVKINPLPGDTNTEAAGVNDRGQVVGVSYNPSTTRLPRAILWENGRTFDLNCFLPEGSRLYLLSANDIDDRGNIVGQAQVLGTTEQPAFLAKPPDRWDAPAETPVRSSLASPVVSQAVRNQVFRRLGIRVP